MKRSYEAIEADVESLVGYVNGQLCGCSNFPIDLGIEYLEAVPEWDWKYVEEIMENLCDQLGLDYSSYSELGLVFEAIVEAARK